MWADGSHVQRLTNTPTGEFDMAWSPHGHTIAFTEALQTNRLFFQLKALNPTTYDVHLLSTTISDYNGLHWSPIIDKAWHPQRLFIGGVLLSIGLIAVLLGQRFKYIPANR